MAFERLIGNNEIKKLLLHTIKTNKILHNYLFIGPKGVGKLLFAKEFTKMILCISENVQNCNSCKSCIEFNGGNHPDFIQIDSEDGKTIKIEQIRFLQGKIAEKPITSEKKVYIINDCDTMTKGACNSLLKTLEEPPTYTVLILITANENKLLETIKSRCTKVKFLPISKKEIEKYLLKKYNTNITPYMLKQCEGSIGKALTIQGDKKSYEQIEKLIENLQKDNIAEIWKNAEILYKNKEKIMEFLDYINVIFFEKFNLEKEIKYLNSISIIENTRKKIGVNANYDMAIDYLLLKLWEEFH